MTRIWKHIIISICVLMATVLFLYTSFSYYSVEDNICSYKIRHHNDDTLRIAFIGDSWAALHHAYDKKMNERLSCYIQRPVSTTSAGLYGATSKQIYSAFSNDGCIQNSLKNGPDYCILSAGINDSQLKKGQYYYQHHIKLIVDFLLQNNIVPIIMEIPNYNIIKCYNESSFAQKIRRNISMFITKSHLDCREQYRNALNTMIESDYPHNNIIILRQSVWNPLGYDDPRHLYRDDDLHLNRKGYEILDDYIIQVILNDFNRK